uniref:Uncharacterized protein n=1 Tax=Trichogramma kaykai TaxID=54128 RepID=A0ABD2W268_9HYME
MPRGVERHHIQNSTGASATATRCRVKHRPDHQHGGIAMLRPARVAAGGGGIATDATAELITATCGSCVTGVLARSNVRASAIFATAKRGEKKESGTRRVCHLCH